MREKAWLDGETKGSEACQVSGDAPGREFVSQDNDVVQRLLAEGGGRLTRRDSPPRPKAELERTSK